MWSMSRSSAVVSSFSRTLFALHAGFAIALSACGAEHPCPSEEQLQYAVRADLSCPSVQEVDEAARSHYEYDISVTVTEGNAGFGEIADRPWTVCWYRVEGSPLEYHCADDASVVEDDGLQSRTLRLALVQETGRDDLWAESHRFSDERTGYPIACDADGLLYGYTIVHEVTTLDAALATMPADCPATVPEEQLIDASVDDPSAEDGKRGWNEAGERLSGLVGRDFYPARQHCIYDVIEARVCETSELGWGFGPK
ncbi:hypothetical protein WMF30_21150 [Sorangium sp. So ce134]